MDARKIIAFGTSSHVISLPKEWMEQNRLKKGDTIYLDHSNNHISLYSDKKDFKQEEREITIDADMKSMERICAEIVSSYLCNYDVIKVRLIKHKEMASEIKSILRNLSGLEIINETNELIVAKDLFNKGEISIKVLLRRIDNIVRSMMEESLESFNADNYKYLQDRDKDINRLSYLAFRLIKAAMKDPSLAKRYEMTNMELLHNHILVNRLEKIADQTKRISKYIIDAKISPKEKVDLRKLYEHLQKSYIDSMKSYHTLDLELALKLELESSERIKMCNSLQFECAKASKVIEHMKSFSAEIKSISRCVVGLAL